jgi:hypothetical protein
MLTHPEPIGNSNLAIKANHHNWRRIPAKLQGPFWAIIAACLLPLTGAANYPVATFAPRELGQKWPSILESYISKGQGVRFVVEDRKTSLIRLFNVELLPSKNGANIFVVLTTVNFWRGAGQPTSIYEEKESWGVLPEGGVLRAIDPSLVKHIQDKLSAQGIEPQRHTASLNEESGKVEQLSRSLRFEISAKGRTFSCKFLTAISSR